MNEVRTGRARVVLAGCAALALAGLMNTPLAAAGKSPAATAQPRLQAYFTTGFDDAAWQRAAFDRVAKVWVVASPPAPNRKTVVLSTITREGKLLESKLDTLSGNAAWDQAALQAVRKAGPFPPLPKTWVNTSLEVHWHFAFAK